MARTHTQNAVSSLSSYFFYRHLNVIRTSYANKFAPITYFFDYVNNERNELNTFSFMKLEFCHRYDVNRMVLWRGHFFLIFIYFLNIFFSFFVLQVFGLGNKTYEHYNKVAIYVDKRLEELGANRVFELGLGDDDAK